MTPTKQMLIEIITKADDAQLKTLQASMEAAAGSAQELQNATEGGGEAFTPLAEGAEELKEKVEEANKAIQKTKVAVDDLSDTDPFKLDGYFENARRGADDLGQSGKRSFGGLKDAARGFMPSLLEIGMVAWDVGKKIGEAIFRPTDWDALQKKTEEQAKALAKVRDEVNGINASFTKYKQNLEDAAKAVDRLGETQKRHQAENAKTERGQAVAEAGASADRAALESDPKWKNDERGKQAALDAFDRDQLVKEAARKNQGFLDRDRKLGEERDTIVRDTRAKQMELEKVQKELQDQNRLAALAQERDNAGSEQAALIKSGAPLQDIRAAKQRYDDARNQMGGVDYDKKRAEELDARQKKLQEDITAAPYKRKDIVNERDENERDRRASNRVYDERIREFDTEASARKRNTEDAMRENWQKENDEAAQKAADEARKRAQQQTREDLRGAKEQEKPALKELEGGLDNLAKAADTNTEAGKAAKAKLEEAAKALRDGAEAKELQTVAGLLQQYGSTTNAQAARLVGVAQAALQKAQSLEQRISQLEQQTRLNTTLQP